MTYFDTALMYLDSWGVTDVILPFVLLFTILFAILMKIKLFTEETGQKDKEGKPEREASRRYNAIIALTIALIVVIPHVLRSYPSDSDPIVMINSFLPGAIVITVALVITLLLIGFLGGSMEAPKSGLVAGAGVLAIIVLGIVIWRAIYPYTGPTWLYWLDDSALQGVVAAILILGLVIWFVVGKGEEKGAAKRLKGWWE
jgi:hypothetical protein